jgi:hypothetical protein
MSHFGENKTSLEILLEEKMKEDDSLLYNLNLEIEDDDFLEVPIKPPEEASHGNRLFTSEKLPPEFRGWISSRPKLLFSLFKQCRFKAVKEELRAIRKRLRQEFWTR